MVALLGAEWIVASDRTLKRYLGAPTGTPTSPCHRLQRLRGSSTYAATPATPGQFVAFAANSGVRPNYAPSDGGASNVGCRIPFSQLTQVGTPGGDTQYVLSAGMNVSGLLIWGEVFVTGTATMRDCIGYGPKKATYSSGLVRGSSYNLRGSLFEWCTFDGTDRESPWTSGFLGVNYTVRYSVITRCNDGLAITGTLGNVVVECCRIVDGYYTAWYNSATGGVYPNFPPSPSDHSSHSDGMQIGGYGGHSIRGNFFGGQPASGWTTSARLLNRDPGIPAQLAYQQRIDSGSDFANSGFLVENNLGSGAQIVALIEYNWVAGGAAGMNLATTASVNGDVLAGVICRYNRWIPDARGRSAGGLKLLMDADCQADVHGNVWDDDGSLLTINLRTGGTRAQSN